MNLLVKWKKMGTEFSYSVWYTPVKLGAWTRAHDTRIIDGIGEENEFVITDLEEETNYSVQVRCHDKYYSWWYSYESPFVVSGGQHEPYIIPDPNWGNVAGFQFYVEAP